ncbi:MAG: adenosylcobinamide-GDP ribazoletransferase [Magnetococcales bacterium]|nr:adenosylcobinamide-GDP ribazoletransferase [Magnetococcales bacterium]
MSPFLAALGLLTRVPIPSFFPSPTPMDLGRSALFFPVVGFLIGVLLALLGEAMALPGREGLAAALLLTGWVVITGGLHLDGLADCADAWIGGMGSREKTLAILKDSRSGPAAISAMVLVLLLKYSAIKIVLVAGAAWWLIWPAMLGRSVMLFLMRSTPYVRAQGMGRGHADHLPRRFSWIVLLLVAMSALIWPVGQAAVLTALLMGWGLRGAFLARLGGWSGDALGASCELTEAAVLVVLVFTL